MSEPTTPPADAAGMIARVRELSGAATKGPWVEMSEEGVSSLRKLFGLHFYPEGCSVIERPPQSKKEAMDTFFEAVLVGEIGEADLKLAAEYRDLCPALADLCERQAGEIERLAAERDAAIAMLAEWCVCVEHRGAGWDDWDDAYLALAAALPALLHAGDMLENECTGRIVPLTRFTMEAALGSWALASEDVRGLLPPSE